MIYLGRVSLNALLLVGAETVTLRCARVAQALIGFAADRHTSVSLSLVVELPSSGVQTSSSQANKKTTLAGGLLIGGR